MHSVGPNHSPMFSCSLLVQHYTQAYANEFIIFKFRDPKYSSSPSPEREPLPKKIPEQFVQLRAEKKELNTPHPTPTSTFFKNYERSKRAVYKKFFIRLPPIESQPSCNEIRPFYFLNSVVPSRTRLSRASQNKYTLRENRNKLPLYWNRKTRPGSLDEWSPLNFIFFFYCYLYIRIY